MERYYIDRVRLREDPATGSYLRTLPPVCHLMRERELSFAQEVTFLVGENGAGKSTLLEGIAVACGFNPEGGTRNFNFSTRDSHSELHGLLTILRSRYPRDGFFLRAESFYNVATEIDELDRIPSASSKISASYGGGSLHELSHGESFLSLLQNRFGGNGLYLLDEPEAALSPARLFALFSAIARLTRQDSQFIIATHSPILMAFPGARIYQMSGEGIEEVSLRQTDHYRLTKYFLENPEQMACRLAAPQDDQADTE